MNGFWHRWLEAAGLLRSAAEAAYYQDGDASPGEYANAIIRVHRALPPDQRTEFYGELVAAGALPEGTDAAYWGEEQFSGDPGDDLAHVARVVDRAFTAGGVSPNIASGGEETPPPGPGLPTARPRPVNDFLVPADATLMVVRNTSGGDDEYLLATNIGTVDSPFQVFFSIGDRARADELLGKNPPLSTEVLTDQQFVQRGFEAQRAGVVDELPQDGQSLRSQIDRQLAQLGVDDIPGWIRADRQAMLLMLQTANGDLSPSGFWTQVRNTSGFGARFPWYATVAKQLPEGATVQAVIEAGVAEETRIRNAVREARGPDAQVQETTATLMQAGWSASEASELLEAESALRRRPDAFRNLNALRTSQGLPPVDENTFVDLVTDRLPEESFRELTAVFQQAALAEQGVDLATAHARLFAEDSDGVTTPDEFRRQSIQAALQIGLRTNDLVLRRFGLTPEDIVASAFDETSPSGLSAADVRQRLDQLQRESEVAARGLGQPGAFLDDRSRLRLQGLGAV